MRVRRRIPAAWRQSSSFPTNRWKRFARSTARILLTYNSPGQVVCAMAIETMKPFAQAVKAAGGRATAAEGFGPGFTARL